MTLRHRVLVVIQESDINLTGAEVAKRAGVSYRQTIFALNALYNMGRIARTGRKFTARWGSIEPRPSRRRQDPPAFVLLEQFFSRRKG
jgi:hypothetical protein